MLVCDENVCKPFTLGTSKQIVVAQAEFDHVIQFNSYEMLLGSLCGRSIIILNIRDYYAINRSLDAIIISF